MNELERLKFILREEEMPMFTDEQLNEFLEKGQDFTTILYHLLLIKSENTGLTVSGLSIQDTSSYFKRLAQMYRPHNTGTLEG